MKRTATVAAILAAGGLLFAGADAGQKRLRTPSQTLTPVVQQGEWSAPVNISPGLSGWNHDPMVASDPTGQKVYAVWCEEEGGGKTVWFNTNETGQWRSKAEDISDYTLGERPLPQIKVDKFAVPVVVFQAKTGGNYEGFSRKYVNGVWGKSENCTSTPRGGSNYIRLVIDRTHNHYYAVWQDDEERKEEEDVYWVGYVKKKASGTDDWRGSGTIDEPTKRAYAHHAAMDLKGKMYVVYDNRAYGDISHVYFTENATVGDDTKWTKTVDVSGSTGAYYYGFAYPHVACDNNDNVYIIWEGASSYGQRDIWFRARINGQWGDMVNLSQSAWWSVNHTIAVNAETGDVHVAWAQEISSTNYDIYYRECRDGEWQPAVNITENSAWSDCPNLFIDDSGSVHLVYEDSRNGSHHMYYQKRLMKAPAYAPVNIAVACSLDETNPSAPTKTNTLTWQNCPQNSGRAMKFYKIFRKESTQGDGSFALIDQVAGGVFTYQDKGLPTNKLHVYRMSAISLWDEESAEPSTSAAEPAMLHAPRGMSLETVTNKYLFTREKLNRLKWQDNPLNQVVNVTGFKVYRKKSDDPDTAYQLLVTTAGTATEYLDRNLPRTVKYRYRVVAADGQGRESVPSSSVGE